MGRDGKRREGSRVIYEYLAKVEEHAHDTTGEY
jgi:hypothetical protein